MRWLDLFVDVLNIAGLAALALAAVSYALFLAGIAPEVTQETTGWGTMAMMALAVPNFFREQCRRPGTVLHRIIECRNDRRAAQEGA